MLEAMQQADNAFVTLTYRDGTYPVASSGLPTLSPEDLQLFVKRLRKKIEPLRIRFYAVGEYGDENERPHYHAALFNFPTCIRGRTRRKIGSGRPVAIGCCSQCELVAETWGRGDVDLGMLETSSAQYVAGYVTKKMTAPDDARLNGRHPEFARMSNRPGIGLNAMFDVADTFLKFDLEKSQADVPVSLAHGKRELPLGRYLRRNLRKMVGRDEKTPEAVVNALKEEMRPLRESAFNASQPYKSAWLDAKTGELRNFHARTKLRKKGRSL